MTVPIQTNRDALQTWLADFLTSNIAISERRRRLIARSDYQPERQMHSDDRKEDATTCPARGTLKAFCYEVNGTCT
jgi:hypothetical protein